MLFLLSFKINSMSTMIYSYYLQTNRKLLEVAAKIWHFNK